MPRTYYAGFSLLDHLDIHPVVYVLQIIPFLESGEILGEQDMKGRLNY